MSLLTDLTESRVFPTRQSLAREDFESISEAAYLCIIALRILLSEKKTHRWAEGYLKKTYRTNFHSWRSDGTDLYIAIHALVEENYRGHPYAFDATAVLRWLRALMQNSMNEGETHRFFLRMDSLFRVRDTSLRSVRRLAMDWPDLEHYDQKLAMTRLLQMVRKRMPRSEMLSMLKTVAEHNDLELDDVCNPETGYCPKETKTKPTKGNGFAKHAAGFAAGMAGVHAFHKFNENATSGATGSASIATATTAVGGLGVGFDPNGDKGIYQTAKKPKVLKR